MDNVTHSLAGLVLAALLVERGKTPAARGAPRTAVYAVSILGNNSPDLDFLYTGITEGKLGNLLHHRGHTHTFVAALGLGALLFAITSLLARRAAHSWTPEDLRRVAIAAFVGPLVHIAMDFQNVYGVHPFWPFDSSWYYGDSIFIVEPLFWAAAIPPLVFIVRTVAARALLGLALAGILALTWLIGFVPPVLAAVSTGFAVFTGLVAFRSTIRRRVHTAVAAWVLVTATFFGGHSVAAGKARALFAAERPGAHLVDSVLSPLPGNPLCFSLLAVAVEGDEYVLRRGILATFPDLFPSTQCPWRGAPTQTAPFVVPATRITDPRAITWTGELSRPLSELRTLAGRCDAAAFLRFARAPFWVDDHEGTVIGDARFDREPELAFAELRLLPLEKLRCPRLVAPWDPPRGDLLR